MQIVISLSTAIYEIYNIHTAFIRCSIHHIEELINCLKESEETCVAEDLMLEFATKFTSKEFGQPLNWDFFLDNKRLGVRYIW